MTMNIEKMTTTLQQSIAEAQKIAMVRQQQTIDIVHLWKIFLQPNHFARNLYSGLGLNVELFEQAIDQEIDKLPQISGSNVQYGQNLSQNLFNLLQEADKIREKIRG